jgi:chromosome segregation ATPase
MKKLFVVDTDKDFQTQEKSGCPKDQVDVQLFSSGMETFSLIAKEKPSLVLVSLDVPDVNDFVMYDLLKKTEDNSIPVVVTYSNQSENDLQQYKKMKFQPKKYCQKPISNDEIHRLLKHHLELDEEDDNEFSDEDIDRLVRGEYLKSDDKSKDDTKELMGDTKNDFNSEVAEAEESEIEIADILETAEDRTSRTDKELKNQVISLEQQNEFLRSENKELAKTIERLKGEIEKGNAKVRELKSNLYDSSADQDEKLVQIETLKSYTQKLEDQNTDLIEKLKTVEEEKARLQIRFKELSQRLTNKEREMNQSSLQTELENLKQSYQQLQNDMDVLKKREESLSRTVSTLAQEKVTLSEKMKIMEEEKVNFSEKVINLKENLTSQQQEMAEKENTHLSALENLNKELEKVLDRLHFYKSRVNELGGLLQQALELTQPEKLE